jgi:hypothetical protein
MLITAGMNSNDATLQAQGRFYGMVKQQAAMLSFLDCFRMLGVVAILALPVALFIKPFGKGETGGH